MPVYYNKGAYEKPEQRLDLEKKWRCGYCSRLNTIEMEYCLLCFAKREEPSTEIKDGKEPQ